MSDRRTIRVAALMEAYWLTGPGRNLIEFARHAAETKDGRPPVELTLVTFQRGASEPNEFIRAARSAGMDVCVLAERYRFDWRVMGQLREAVGQIKPDVIQTHNVKSHLLVRSTGLGQRYPWLAFHHGYTTTDLRTRLYNQLDRWSLRGAARVVTVCGAFSRQLRSLGVRENRIRVRHNPVKPLPMPEAEEVEAARLTLGLQAGRAVLVSVGRLSREKGHADLLHAAAELLHTEPRLQFHVVIVGDGPERSRLESLCRALELQEVVRFAGHQRKARIYYELADAVVLPSHSEGSPNVLLEAVDSSCPIVATAVGGVPELVCDEQSALLVPPHDRPALARALRRTLDEPELTRRLAGQALRSVCKRHTLDAYAGAIIGIYEEVLGASGARRVKGEELACVSQ